MATISATDVAKLRKITGAGMMDCKKALEETNGDFDAAIDVLRKKGQKVANKRADRETTEGAVIAKVSADNSFGVLISLNCETDFVAKNEKFVKLAHDIADIALANKTTDKQALLQSNIEGHSIESEIANQNGIIGEKVELGVFEFIDAPFVAAYIHSGNRLASLCGFSKSVDSQVAKDIVMQIAAMSPISVSREDVPQDVIDKEIEIGKELAINEGKSPDMAEKIAIGKLNKFYQESTLMEQAFIKDNKMTVKAYLESTDKALNVTGFKRYTVAI